MLLTTTPGGAPIIFRQHGVHGLGATAAEAAALAQKSIDLKALQTALVNLSAATHNTAINPGTPSGALYNGLPDDKTMGAVAAAMGLIGPKLPTWANVSLSVAFGLGVSTDKAKQLVLDYSTYLKDAAIAATITAPYYTKPEAPAQAQIPSVFATSGPWYKTWWGIGAIAIGGLGFLSLLASRRAAQ
jgi:hypothetical protein